jgi:hypothetical protein
MANWSPIYGSQPPGFDPTIGATCLHDYASPSCAQNALICRMASADRCQTRGSPGARQRVCRASHGHRLPLSTCHVPSGPRMTWRVTAPDSTVAPLPLRLICRQP